MRIAPLLLLALTGCLAPFPVEPWEDPDNPGLDGDLIDPGMFRTTDDQLARVLPDGSLEPFFMVGPNLGVGVPGTQPGEVALTYDEYRRWFQLMSDQGANAFRIYTLHYPRFYEALRDHNLGREDPLLVLHGIWLKEELEDDDLFSMTEDFDHAIEEVISAAHGDRVVEHRFGEAYGAYDVDISRWVLGWVAGREVDPWEILATLSHHDGVDHYDGERLSLPEGNPIEAWLAERLDHIVDFEASTYGVTRPVSFSSWPTLDPLEHPTEGPESSEDWFSVDLGNLDLHGAPGGYFASYHAYPYYPDFMNEQSEYLGWSDDEGPNSYLGYLHDLKAHYIDTPLLIAEYGVPTSWGNAHYAQSGMHHGGHDEATAGQMAIRLTRNLAESDCAGGMWFAWMDEWWKQSWITNEIEFPVDRRPLWRNWMGPEQNYGVLAYDPPPPDWDAWAPVVGDGPVAALRGAWTTEDFRVRLELDTPLQPGETITLGFDTSADDRGESVLPLGEPSPRRVELALVIDGTDVSQLYVTQAYDLWGIWHDISDPTQVFHSVASDDGLWNQVWWVNNDLHGPGDGTIFPRTEQPIGALPTRHEGDPESSHHMVVIGPTRIDVTLPWTLLQFTDPSAREVMDDDRDTFGREATTSDGIAVVMARGGQRLVSPRWRWDTWDVAPPTVERIKPAYYDLQKVYRELTGAR